MRIDFTGSLPAVTSGTVFCVGSHRRRLAEVDRVQSDRKHCAGSKGMIQIGVADLPGLTLGL